MTDVETKAQDLKYEQEVLDLIHRTSQKWLAVLGMLYLGMRALNVYVPLYKRTAVLDAAEGWVTSSGFFFVMAVVFIGSPRGKNPRFQYQILVLLSLLSVGAAVFLTGGLLDSPFAGVLALYVGSFILMQDDASVTPTLRPFNILLVVITVVLIVIPYLVADVVFKQKAFLTWCSTSGVMYFRTVAATSLLLLTGYAAYRLDRGIDKARKAMAPRNIT